jgi:hypothetical protein
VNNLLWGQSSSRVLDQCVVVSLIAMACVAYGQDYPIPQEVHVTGLRRLMARSHEPSDVLLTSLDTILHDRTVCCGKDSALGDSAQGADPASLKEIAMKLQGRHLLSDGRPIAITAEYVEPQAINSGMLITTLRDRHALLLQWNAHVYVCFGVAYGKYYDPNSGSEMDTIYKFLLLDTRYSDSRREVVFDRKTDDWSKVQGILRLTVAQ